MQAFARRARSLLLFLLIPGLSAVAPLIAYPAITARYGAEGFAAIAIGQSMGVTAAIICELGWSVIGPQAIARGADSSSMHRASVATKLMALAVGLPTAAVVAFSVAVDFQIAAAATAAALSLSALSPVWVLTGLNRPGVILGVDVVPRIALSLSSAVAINWGAPLTVFAAAAGLGTMLSIPLAGWTAGFRVVPMWSDFANGARVIRRQLPLTAGRSVSVVYTTLVTTVVAAVAPGSVALYAATDRVLRMGLAVLAGVPSRLQSWLGQSSDADRRRRSVQSLITNTALGLLAAVSFFVAADPFAQILFSGTIVITDSTAALGSLIALMVCTSRGFGLSLVSANRANAIALGSVVGAVVGGAAALALIPGLGANGGLIAVAAAELAGILVQGVALSRTLRRPDDA